MAFRLRQSQSLGKNLRRLCRGQIRGAIRELRGESGPDRDTAIHNFRRYTKKMRSLLRLTRYQLGKDVYRRENAFFRNAARELAGSRDAAVMPQTLRRLTEDEAAAAAGTPAAERFTELLAEHYEEMMATHLDTRGVMAEVAAAMAAALARVKKWPLSNDWSSVSEGLRRVYGQGRRAMRAATHAPTFQSYHEWRKRAKCLWHHVLILEPLWPETLNPLATELRDLATALGDEHDLAVLHEALDHHGPAVAGLAGLRQLQEGLARRQTALRQRACLLGACLYAEKPWAFARRLTAYWEAWR